MRLARTLGLSVAFIVVAAAGQAAWAQESDTIDLFDTSGGGNRQGLPADAEALGMLPGTVGAVAHFSLTPAAGRSLRSGGAPGRMRIALPGGGVVTCDLTSDQAQNDVQVMRGTTAGGDATDHCYLVVKDGKVTGDIQTRSGRYRIMPAGPGNTHAIVEVRTEGFPEEGDVLRPDFPRRNDRSMLNKTLCDVADAGDRGSIDVMVLYTPATAAHQDMNVVVAEAMTQLAQAFISDNFNVDVHLVHSQEVDYIEGDNLGVDLERLSGREPGYFESIPALRDQYKADIVHLIVEGKGDACGIGWMDEPGYLDSADYAFSVTDRRCAAGNYSFAHEIGHNVGMNHDRYVVEDPSPDDINFGYISLSAGHRTLMAYDKECRDKGVKCPRVLTYSTPAPVMDGTAQWGVAPPRPNSAYNREILCRNAPGTAEYR